MSVDEHIEFVESVLERLVNFKDKYYKYGDKDIDDIVIQLNFIRDAAKSGNSFKRALIERKKAYRRDLMEENPIDDGALSNALRAVYDDLESHDYNVGRLSQEMSLHFYELIIEKTGEYGKEYLYEKNLHDEKLRNNYIIAYIASDDLRWGGYYDVWIKHGIKKLQYFFLLSNIFSFGIDSYDKIRTIDEDFARQLHKDIIRIRDFYQTDEAEGTHMYLNPVEFKEIDGRPHLVDLKGNIVA